VGVWGSDLPQAEARSAKERTERRRGECVDFMRLR